MNVRRPIFLLIVQLRSLITTSGMWMWILDLEARGEPAHRGGRIRRIAMGDILLDVGVRRGVWREKTEYSRGQAHDKRHRNQLDRGAAQTTTVGCGGGVGGGRPGLGRPAGVTKDETYKREKEGEKEDMAALMKQESFSRSKII